MVVVKIDVRCDGGPDAKLLERDFAAVPRAEDIVEMTTNGGTYLVRHVIWLADGTPQIQVRVSRDVFDQL